MKHKPGKLAYRLYRFMWDAIDWLYPPNCGGCNQPGSRWCEKCSFQSHEVSPPICPICGDYNVDDQLCQKCSASIPFYTLLRSHAVFDGPLREAIHKLKYKGDMGLGEALSRPMIDSLRKLNWPLDIITPVPLGLVRLAERGYNQATLLARPIALYLDVPFSTGLLTRIRETRSQVGLNLTERQGNMDNAFMADRKLANGKNVLVVDDVATSGATLNACAKALLDAGASKIYGFSLARAIFTSGDDNAGS